MLDDVPLDMVSEQYMLDSSQAVQSTVCDFKNQYF